MKLNKKAKTFNLKNKAAAHLGKISIETVRQGTTGARKEGKKDGKKERKKA